MDIATLNSVDVLFASLFSLVNVLAVSYLIYSTVTLSDQSVRDVSLCVFSGRIIALFFFLIVTIAFVFAIKWQFLYSCLSLIAMASTMAFMLDTMSRRAVRILMARGW